MAGVDKVGLPLDEIIRNDGIPNRRGGGSGNRAGNNRGFRSGRLTRAGGNAFRNRGGGGIPRTQNASTGRWKHDLYENNGNQTRMGVNSTTKLVISNLDFGVTTDDIQELFGDIGAIRVARVHFDETGQSLGTGEVVYERRADAMTALKKYNTLNLDGRPMDIKLVGGFDDSSQLSTNNGNTNRNQRFTNRNGNNNQQNGIRTSTGRQQNGTNRKKNEITADDLDAELDAYRAESKQNK